MAFWCLSCLGRKGMSRVWAGFSSLHSVLSTRYWPPLLFLNVLFAYDGIFQSPHLWHPRIANDTQTCHKQDRSSQLKARLTARFAHQDRKASPIEHSFAPHLRKAIRRSAESSTATTLASCWTHYRDSVLPLATIGHFAVQRSRGKAETFRTHRPSWKSAIVERLFDS